MKTLKIDKDFRNGRLGDAQQYLRQIVAQMDQGYTSGEGWDFSESDSLPKASDIVLPSELNAPEQAEAGKDEGKGGEEAKAPENAPQQATEASSPAPEGGKKKPWWDRD